MKLLYAKIDIALSALLVGLSVFVYRTALGFRGGADIFPRFLSVAMIFFSILLLVGAVRKLNTDDERTDSQGSGFLDPARILPAIRPYLVFGMVVLYIILIPVVGFFVMTTIFCLVVMVYLGVRKPFVYVVTIAGLVIGIYLLFVLQLNVPVPRGFLM